MKIKKNNNVKKKSNCDSGFLSLLNYNCFIIDFEHQYYSL